MVMPCRSTARRACGSRLFAAAAARPAWVVLEEVAADCTRGVGLMISCPSLQPHSSRHVGLAERSDFTSLPVS